MGEAEKETVLSFEGPGELTGQEPLACVDAVSDLDFFDLGALRLAVRDGPDRCELRGRGS